MDFEIAQLRHAYILSKNGYVQNTEEFADGLLAPVIRVLERINSKSEKSS